MAYQIKVTYRNHVTGEGYTKVLPKRYKTWRGAETTARRSHRWATVPDRDTRIDEMHAEVIEVK